MQTSDTYRQARGTASMPPTARRLPTEPNVVVVVVTHNRRDLLVEALTALGEQTRSPDGVVVVDNASGDDTADVVRADFPRAALLSLPYNAGGAGGFAAGISRALDAGADLVWLMDDDTVPEPPALAELLRARTASVTSAPTEYPALVASRAVWTDGRPHPMNAPRRKPGASGKEAGEARAAGCVPIRSASFVSVLVDADLVRRRGLPIADYFVWNDDFEFTARLLRGKRGLLCPASRVVHKTRTFGSTDADPGERFFYEVRNKVWLFGRSSCLAPAERVLYAGSTLRRWGRTFARSGDRATLRRAFRRGLAAGLRSRPRATAAALADMGLPTSGSGRTESENTAAGAGGATSGDATEGSP